ncbi:extracellular solute-binding protein [Paenibacillus sp. HJGM_3]|uniref:extracellular solute-binding protein n=1 Tax=Paenibacillus sp. HJGM_3 TaxID=3379816 RepID=UPI00385D3807
MSSKWPLWRPVAMLAMAAAVLVSGNSYTAPITPAFAADPPATTAASADKPSLALNDELGPYYGDVLADWRQKGYKPASQAAIRIPGTALTAQAPQKLAAEGSYEGKSGVLVWKSDRDNWIEYEVDIAQDGLYEMALAYHPYNEANQASTQSVGRQPAVLGMQIDGQYPFREARALTFRRKFKDEFPLKQAANGDDIRPRPVELKQWMNEPLMDAAGGYSTPFQWYLGKGKHKLRISGSTPIVIEALTLKPPASLPNYEQAKAASKSSNANPSAAVPVIQAEQASWKNDLGIQMVANQDPLSLPKTSGYIRFNTLGGDRWATGGQSAAWTFEVPESGMYKIAMRSFQGFASNKAVFRTIAIDGNVPFQELLEYRFPYSFKWKGAVLSQENGEAFQFYLEKGTHTLSMTATVGPFQPIIVQGERVINLLRQVDEEIRAMNGGQVDKNRTWKVDAEFPELPKQLEEAKAQLTQMKDMMLQANKARDNTVQTMETALQDLAGYLKHPNEIPYHMDDISSMIERLGGIREVLVRSPLQLDQIYIEPAGGSLPKMEANLWQRVSGSVRNFIYSFIRKEDINTVDEDTLNVWVNRSRDYVNLLQELVNESFTPQTGIRVKVNLLPNENLLVLANAAGLSPDVALGQPQDKSTDFAMRNALLDLSQFPDFQQVAKQFAPGAMLPFYYNQGYYALPETQSFKVLFYRKDILNRLRLTIPDTWTDVYNMLPTLQQNGYNFYMPPTDSLPFFYQNGAEFFSKDGMRSAMNVPEAFKGFKQWTDLFNIYALEKQVPNFFQHFRKGDFPIGVADYNTYVQLTVAAPELAGWWGIAPMPGTKQADGTVARWAAGGQTTGFIYKSSKHPKESWEFLKWLVSSDTQVRYGTDLEAFNGIAFRWSTANIDAFTKLPWPKDDLKVILEQWRWYKEIPNLPGSYFLTRELGNAWNRTVVNGMNDRESLEEAIANLDREMVRKQQEFGFVNSVGEVLRTLDLPQVTQPWEGVNPYVR